MDGLSDKMDRLVAKIDRRSDEEVRYDPQLSNIRFRTLGFKASLQNELTLRSKMVRRLERSIDSLSPRASQEYMNLFSQPD